MQGRWLRRMPGSWRIWCAVLVGMALLAGVACPGDSDGLTDNNGVLPPDSDDPGSGDAPSPEPDPAPEPDPDPAPDPEPQGASISGRLVVQVEPNTRTLREQEPNDDLSQTQFVARVRAGQTYSIFGDVSLLTGDFIDAFEFVAEERVYVELELSFIDNGIGREEDLDLAVFDFENFNCAPGGVGEAVYAHCFDTTRNPETGSFEIEGPFVIVVSLYDGRSPYQLDIRFLSPDEAPEETDTSPPFVTGSSKPALAEKPATAFQKRQARAFTEVSEGVSCDEVLVSFAWEVSYAEQEEALRGRGLRLVERSPSGVVRARCAAEVKGDARRRRVDLLGRLAELRGVRGVRGAELAQRRYIALTPNDEHYGLQWHYQAINLPAAWDITTGSDDVIVAVVDTGILSGHPDLQGRLVDGYDFISDPASARDGDGRDDNPEDEGDEFGGPGRSSFHGTHVSGTIAATTNNEIGVAGVTWMTKLMPLRALGVNGGSTFDVAEAIRYAAGLPNVSGRLPARPAHVINLSLSGVAGAPASQVELDAIADAAAAGALIVGAAGNHSSSEPAYPSASPDVVSVSALDIELGLTPYSNFGATIELAAPGGFTGTDINGDGFGDGVLSTGASDAGGTISHQYVFSNGTSMAAPHVSGVAALMLAANPQLSAAELREILQLTARDLGVAGRDDVYGYGLVDAGAAVREASARGGGVVDSDPALALSTSSLDFGYTRRELRVNVTNTGGGFLQIDELQVETLQGAGWLEVSTAGSAVNANASAVVVSVTRSGLDEGQYAGRVTVGAEGVTPGSIDVSMDVGTPETIEEAIYVLAVTPEELESVAQDITGADRDWQYHLEALPAGQYAVYAGTDRNDDGFICDIGDLCGALPSLIEPGVIHLDAGDAREGADFGVAAVVLQQISEERDGLRLERIR